MFFAKLGQGKKATPATPASGGQIKITKVKVPVASSTSKSSPHSRSGSSTPKRDFPLDLNDGVRTTKSRKKSNGTASGLTSPAKRKSSHNLERSRSLELPDHDDSSWATYFNKKPASHTPPIVDNRDLFCQPSGKADIIESKSLVQHAEYKPC